jgi:cell division protein FtsZ
MIFGAVIDPNMGDEIRVTVIATGFERSGVPRRALERVATRTERPAPAATNYFRPSESVSVDAEVRHSGESKPSASSPLPTYGSDDLDIPAFMRKRR